MKRILLVDDEAHVIRVMQHALEREGYSVDSARNGELALDKIRIQQPDAMVVDVQMPRMSGDQLCLQLREEFPLREFLIMVCTSRTEAEYRDWSKDFQNLIFVEKPMSIRVLLSTLSEYFNAQGKEQ